MQWDTHCPSPRMAIAMSEGVQIGDEMREAGGFNQGHCPRLLATHEYTQSFGLVRGRIPSKRPIGVLVGLVAEAQIRTLAG